MKTRRNFSLATIKARLEYAGWQCEGRIADGSRCKTIVQKGRFRCDHVIPDRMGGKPTFENAQILCLLCDGIKTPMDLTAIGKVRRQEAADFRVKIKSGHPLPCGKRSSLKRKIDGTIVSRRPPLEQSINAFPETHS